LSEACIDIAYQEKSNQMSEDDLLDFYNRYRLSTAEAKVVEKLVDNSIAETADKLKIKEITVRTHINNIRRKISVSNDAERLLKQTAS
jgi:DNA-binding CsgD family transcriptional regulator